MGAGFRPGPFRFWPSVTDTALWAAEDAVGGDAVVLLTGDLDFRPHDFGLQLVDIRRQFGHPKRIERRCGKP